ncbi:hypothetical protein [Gilvibacter sp.]|uniref:hypothetical protein n=1 Tax=Gilvibacter sp. TaxID=2729997 RepID=UPI0025C5C0DC|nr:hypothetical protein [Gilvibacter sp.]NQX77508.1 hypothetical protein [Gilvibacter sp.]
MASTIATKQTQIANNNFSALRLKDALDDRSITLINAILGGKEASKLINNSIAIHVLDESGVIETKVGIAGGRLWIEHKAGQPHIVSDCNGLAFQVLNRYGKKDHFGFIEVKSNFKDVVLELEAKQIIQEYQGAKFDNLRTMDSEILQKAGLVLIVKHPTDQRLYLKNARGANRYSDMDGTLVSTPSGPKVCSVTAGKNFWCDEDQIHSDLPHIHFMVKWSNKPTDAVLILV